MPTLLFTILLWLSLTALIYFVDPFSFGALPGFFILVFFGLLFTFSLLFANSRRGLLISLSLSLFLLLRYLGVGHLLNFLLLAGLAITIELYFSHNAPHS